MHFLVSNLSVKFLHGSVYNNCYTHLQFCRSFQFCIALHYLEIHRSDFFQPF